MKDIEKIIDSKNQEVFTYAQRCILEKIAQKHKRVFFQDLHWGEYLDYNDYNDAHGDYYDADSQ